MGLFYDTVKEKLYFMNPNGTNKPSDKDGGVNFDYEIFQKFKQKGAISFLDNIHTGAIKYIGGKGICVAMVSMIVFLLGINDLSADEFKQYLLFRHEQWNTIPTMDEINKKETLNNDRQTLLKNNWDPIWMENHIIMFFLFFLRYIEKEKCN